MNRRITMDRNGTGPRGQAPDAVTQGIRLRAQLDPSSPTYASDIAAINDQVVRATFQGASPVQSFPGFGGLNNPLFTNMSNPQAGGVPGGMQPPGLAQPPGQGGMGGPGMPDPNISLPGTPDSPYLGPAAPDAPGLMDGIGGMFGGKPGQISPQMLQMAMSALNPPQQRAPQAPPAPMPMRGGGGGFSPVNPGALLPGQRR
jgi:hypothetical protein